MSDNNFPDEIFKAYDIRGIVDKTLTTDIVFKVGQALGSEALKKGRDTIVTGRDGRLSGPSIQGALNDGIMAAGCHVINIGMVPTPVVYYAAYKLNTGCCVAVTGSHNPPDYNGIKMVIDEKTLSGDDIQAIKQRIINNDLSKGSGASQDMDVRDEYIERITSDINMGRPLNIVVDCGNGVAGELGPRLLRELGCNVTELFCEIDGHFPNHHPDPSQPDNLKDLIAAVKEQKADLGMAFDGDGDRLGVIAPDGKIIWADRQMILYVRDILKHNPGAEIIYDVKCSRTLHKEIEKAGGRPLMWKTGHSFIKAKLKETGAAFAGEMSGHLFFNDRWYGFDDALYSAARLVEILSNSDESTQDIFANLPDTVSTPELRLEGFAEGEHFAAMEKIAAKADFDDAQRISTIDGLRVDWEDGFGLIRASNTTPILVIRFEADTEEALKRIQDKFRALIESAIPGTALPF
ncbi:MAG: phosphomannomutase/phosphoglucomutase [Gammaproteobacteria bacterium]|nr:MAG: phosphomannomutase/phosphoglucomutase [Gammaproteobacteria bacterium]